MTYTPVLPPYPHQVEALAKMEGKRAFALLMEMRTGKTKVILDDWGRMVDAREVRDLLYVSPSGALYGQDALETQVLQHLPPDLKERTRVAVWRSNSAKSKREAEALLKVKDRPRILLINVEAFSTVAAANELASLFLFDEKAVFVIGESTCIKGGSKRTDALMRLSTAAPYRRIETGLVTPHSPLDLYYQFAFLDPSILRQRSWFNFRARYALTKKVCFLPRDKQEELRRMGKRLPEATVVVAYRNEDELAELIAPHSYRKRFRDCARVPAGSYLFRDVTLTEEQTRLLREFKEYATTQIGGTDAHMTATVALTQILRFHQLICGFAVDEEGNIHDVPERRTTALIDILEECEGQAVIWATYNHNIKTIVAKLRRRFDPEGTPPEQSTVVSFWGGNANTRTAEEARFKSGQARFMVANPAAGGKGREWSCANLMVYYSNSYDLEDRDQSEMRIEAVQKVDPVTRIDLRVPGTVDDKIIKNLRAKIDIATMLQGDGYKEWLV